MLKNQKKIPLSLEKIHWYLSWKGLIGAKPKPIFFSTRFGVHTFFMSEPIDVLILDKNNTVKKQKESLTPNHFFFWNPLFSTVVELPQRTIKNNNIQVGDTIIVKTP